MGGAGLVALLRPLTLYALVLCTGPPPWAPKPPHHSQQQQQQPEEDYWSEDASGSDSENEGTEDYKKGERLSVWRVWKTPAWKRPSTIHLLPFLTFIHASN